MIHFIPVALAAAAVIHFATGAEAHSTRNGQSSRATNQRGVATQGNRQPPGQQDKMMQVVAIVNGQQITRQQLAHETVRRFGEKVIESVINKQLIYNELIRRNMDVTYKDVNDEINRQAAKLGFTADKYLELIQSKRHISISRIKNDVFWTEIALRRLAESETRVTEQEIVRQMETEFGEKVLIRIIALDNQQKAQQIHAAVKAK